MLCTSRLGGSTSRFSPSAMSITSGTPDLYSDPGVHSEVVLTPKLYFALISGSVIASQRRSGVVLM